MPESKSVFARSNRVHENSLNSNGERSPKAVVFARAVCAEHANERIAAQLKSCGDYAASHRIEVLREFTSVGRAGREEFGAMLNFVKKNCDCRMIIVEKIDRLCRNLSDFVAVEDFLEQLGARVHLVKEVRTINSQAKAQDKLIREMFVLLARNYILNMQEEIQKQQTAASSTERLVRGQPTSAENRR